MRDNVAMPSPRCLATFSLPVLLAACVAEPTDLDRTAQAADAIAKHHACADDALVQPGAALVLLGVTADDHAIYQDGSTVYATALHAGAAPVAVGSVPAGNTAFAYIAGKVAFVWTNPDYSMPGYGVSPLEIYSAAYGAAHASDASPIGTLVTAASDDGRRITFPDNTDAAGSVADLIIASPDLSTRSVLIADIAANFPSGPCRPNAVFLGHGKQAYPAVAACASGAPRATLSTWRNGVRADIGDLRTPPRLTVDPDGKRIGTMRYDAANAPIPVVITPATGAITVLDPGAPASRVLFGGDGAALWVDATTAVHRVKLPKLATAEVVVPALAALFGGGAGSQSLGETPTSADGRALLYATTFDPSTGLSDILLADLKHGTSATIDAGTSNYVLFGNPFTRDSKFVVTNSITDLTTFAGPLVATRVSDLDQRDISDDRPANWLFGAGDDVVVGDNFVFGTTLFDSTVDLSVVDASSGQVREVAAGANFYFFVADGGHAVVYTIPGQGLFVDD